MNPSTQSPPCTAHFEPIEVRRIRLMQAAGTSAVVSEFRAADQVLARWIGCERGRAARREFSFEITFTDGYTFCGCYEFWRSARRQPSLTRFVRAMFMDLAAPPAGVAPVDLSRYAIETT